MVADDFPIDAILDFLLQYPIFTNSILGASLLTNTYLFKKFRDNSDSEKNQMSLLKDIEPLLAKIIRGDKFDKVDKEDAKTIRNIIKSKIRKDVK